MFPPPPEEEGGGPRSPSRGPGLAIIFELIGDSALGEDWRRLTIPSSFSAYGPTAADPTPATGVCLRETPSKAFPACRADARRRFRLYAGMRAIVRPVVNAICLGCGRVQDVSGRRWV